jgi:hypothetical protein
MPFNLCRMRFFPSIEFCKCNFNRLNPACQLFSPYPSRVCGNRFIPYATGNTLMEKTIDNTFAQCL